MRRVLKLMRRDWLELLNLGILLGALDDPDFIAKITANVKALQKEGLILLAAADTFSGQETYKAMMASGAFATLNINFNIADDYPEREIFPFARKQNMRVVVREVFIKGVLFRLAKEACIGDDGLIAGDRDEMARVTGRNRQRHSGTGYGRAFP